MLIPKPLDVDAMIRKVRAGRFDADGAARKAGAAAGADVACAMVTGMFVRIVAEAAEEDLRRESSRDSLVEVVRDDGNCLKNCLGRRASGGGRTRDTKSGKLRVIF